MVVQATDPLRITSLQVDMCLARCLKCLSGGSSESVDCAFVVAVGVAEPTEPPGQSCQAGL